MTVEVVDVRREYGIGGRTVTAVDGVSLSLEGGQFVAIVGASGAGKSTLLHLIGGLDRPTSGSISVDGCNLAELDDEEQSRYRRRQVGFIFQFFNLLPTMSAWENVAIPRLLDGVPMAKVKNEAVALLDMVGLRDRKDHRPAELSGGQMQRVAIARSMIMDPQLILADEPTGNLDSKTGMTILELIADIAHADSRRLVAIVTHDLGAAATADRIITMRDGRVLSDTKPGAGGQ
jgi:putative ABC transport system ATP-binding protein